MPATLAPASGLKRQVWIGTLQCDRAGARRTSTRLGVQLRRKAPGFSQNWMPLPLALALALAFHLAGHVRLCLILKLSFEHDPQVLGLNQMAHDRRMIDPSGRQMCLKSSWAAFAVLNIHHAAAFSSQGHTGRPVTTRGECATRSARQRTDDPLFCRRIRLNQRWQCSVEG